jgi:hypothetical protein
MVLANVVLARAIVRTGAATVWALVVSGAWAATLCSLTAVGGWTVLGAALGLSYAGQMGPAVWTAYRTRVPTGIAPVYWLANLTETALWGLYGVVHRDRAVVLFALVGVTASSAILLRWWWAGRGRLSADAGDELLQQRPVGIGSVQPREVPDVLHHLQTADA